MPAEAVLRKNTCDAGRFTIGEIAYAPGLVQPRHAHDYMGVTLVLAGTIREQAASREEVGAALSVVVKPVGVEHANEVGRDGARTLQIAFDPAAIDGLESSARLSSWCWSHAGDRVAPLLGLLRAIRQGTPAALLEECVVDAMAGLGDRTVLRTAPAWLVRVRDALHEAESPASVRALAHEAGVHEVTLSRAFRECFGCTLGEYRRRLRLARAARTIARAPANLSRTAHETGYADHAHMTREFRRSTGLTPSQYRELALG